MRPGLYLMRAASRHVGIFCSLLTLISCGGGDTVVNLDVFIRTDYQPFRDFVGVITEVDSSTETRVASLEASFVTPGAKAASFPALFVNERRAVTVTLVDPQGAELASSRVLVEHVKDTILTISITNDCKDVTCDDAGGLAQRCLAGQCVDARCASGKESFCQAECNLDADCPTPAGCGKASCTDGVCFTDTQAEDVCPEGLICDSKSGCVPNFEPCAAVADCSLNAEACLNVACIKDDAGSGQCVYSNVENGTACTGGSCSAGKCAPPSCTDKLKNQDETDVDCGGIDCPACSNGQTCQGDNDCASLVCDTLDSQTCESTNVCGNAKLESNEGCDDGNIVAGDGCNANCLIEGTGSCTASFECASGFCGPAMTCQTPTCNDGFLNRDESAVDCGGMYCDTCALGIDCNMNSDCASGVCDTLDSGQCEMPDTCGNGVVETGESCDDGNTSAGDGCFGNCSIEDGESCTDHAACTYGYCNPSNLCETPNCVNNGVQDGTEAGVDCGAGCVTACSDYNCGAQTDLTVADCEALKDVYDALDGHTWTNATGWFQDASPCSWTGVSCNMLRVTSIILSEDNVRGVLPESIGDLDELTRIEIHPTSCCVKRTYLTGGFPTSIGNLTKLRHIRVDNNRLNAPLPPEFGNLAELVTVDFARNQMSGPLPTTIGGLQKLETFSIYYNKFDGTLPNEFGDMSALRSATMSNNLFSGAIPATIGNLTALDYIWLQKNQLTGNIPEELGGLSALRIIYLQENQLTGPLPSTIGGMTNLQLINVADNMLSGAIPSDITTLGSLSTVDLCNQAGGLTADMATGSWLRMRGTTDWPVGDSC